MFKNLSMISNMLSVPVVAEPRLLDMYMKALAKHVAGDDHQVRDHKKRSGVGIVTGEHNGIGIMEISGTMVPRAMEMDTMCGDSFISTLDATQAFIALADQYDEILLQVDSGGGSVTGVPEFAAAIRNSKAHVIGFTDTVAASGGYWALSACDEIVATPSAQLGSIGVYIPVLKTVEGANPFTNVHYFSAGDAKLYGAPDVALTDAESAHFQGSVDSTYKWFTESVAEYRGLEVSALVDTQAKVFQGKETIGLLADRIVNNIMEV